MPVRWIDGLTKEIHHIKVMDGNSNEYEPTLVIMDHKHPGSSFQIPLTAMWKYIDPIDNRDPPTLAMDKKEFEKLIDRIQLRLSLTVDDRQRQLCYADMACVAVARALADRLGFLLCTAWNIAKIMQMFNIPAHPVNAAHLLMWIQDALDDLRSAPPVQLPEDTFIGGEATVYAGSQKIAQKEMILTESDLIAEEEETIH